MKRILLELDDQLAAEIDKRRGDVPRVRWIRSLIVAAIGNENPVTEPPPPVDKMFHVKQITSTADPYFNLLPAIPAVDTLRAKIPARNHHPACKCPICQPVKETK